LGVSVYHKKGAAATAPQEKFFLFLFTALTVGYNVENNCDQQNAAFYYVLPGVADTHDGHTHVDDTQ
jgi:hypothetical protein